MPKHKKKTSKKIGGAGGEQSRAPLSPEKVAEFVRKRTADENKAELQEAQIANNKAAADKSAAATAEKNLKWFRTMVGTILEVPRQLAGLFSRQYPISHYLALIVFIILLIGGISFFAIRSKKGVSKKKSSWIPTPITQFFQRFMPGYKMSLLAGQLSSEQPPTEPRETLPGRCDNVTFKQSSIPGQQGGLCTNVKLPDPITWVIDSEKIKELNEIPQSIKDKISNKGAKFIVKIPWKSSGLVYTPDCDNATYSDGTPAYLLIDNGLVCNKVELEKITYNPLYRMNPLHSGYKGLDVFE